MIKAINVIPPNQRMNNDLNRSNHKNRLLFFATSDVRSSTCPTSLVWESVGTQDQRLNVNTQWRQ